MTAGKSSCRPARLKRFDETLGAVADGLARRAGTLGDALAVYQARCAGSYQVPTAGTEGVVLEFGSGLRQWGQWVGAVGQAFLDVSGNRAYIKPAWATHPEHVARYTDDDLMYRLARYLDPGDDPFRGVPEGSAEDFSRRLGARFDPDGPPAWITWLANGGTISDISKEVMTGTAKTLAKLPPEIRVTHQLRVGAVAVLRDGSVVGTLVRADLFARLRLPTASAPRIAGAANLVGAAGMVASGAAGAGMQWYNDQGLPTGPRVARAATRGVSIAAFGALGGLAGGVAGLSCGPAAPVCSAVLGAGGAINGGKVGDVVAGWMPWMDPPRPGEHHHGVLRDQIAMDDHDVDLEVAARVDLAASDIALNEAADNPAFQKRVASILPDRERLEHVITTGSRPENAPPPPHNRTTTTTTTTTTLPLVPPAIRPETRPETPGPPDPWVERRPYEP